MSVSLLLNEEVKNQAWSHLYANEIETENVVATNATIDNVTIASGGTISTFDLVVTNDAIIHSNNFNITNGQGTSGQVLSTDGAGHLSWESNGNGDVVGPNGSFNGTLCNFADTTGKLIADTGINANNVMTNDVQIECNDQLVNNVKGLILKDQSLISLQPLVDSHQLYAKLSDGKIYSQTNLGVSHPIAYENADVTFASVSATGPIETDGAQLVLNDGVSAGSAIMYFESAGVIQKVIQLNANQLQFLRSDFGTICTMEESGLSHFFGNVQIDGNLIQSNVSNQTMSFTGTINTLTNYYFNSVGDPNNLGATASSVVTDQVVVVNSKIKKFAYNTTSGDGTSQVQIYKNGVGTGAFLLSGLSGTVSLNISCNAGDTLAIKQEAGTDVGLSVVSIHLVGS